MRNFRWLATLVLLSGACEGVDDSEVQVEALSAAPQCTSTPGLDGFCADDSVPVRAAPLHAHHGPAIETGVTYGVRLRENAKGASGSVSLTVEEGGTFMLYVGTPKMPTRVVGPDGEVAPTCENWIDKTTCVWLRRVGAYDLEAGTYRIEFGPISPQHWVRLRVERKEEEPPPPPPGGGIVFAAMLGSDTETHLYVVQPDGSGLTRLATSGGEIFPSWSPDRQKLAYVRAAELWVSDAAGQGEVMVAPQVGRDGQYITPAAWSPDGMRLAYTFPRDRYVIEDTDESYETTLHYVNADGTGDVAFPEPTFGGAPPGIGSLSDPAWSSTDRLAFAAADDCPDCAGGAYWSTMMSDGTGYAQVVTGVPPLYPVHGLDWSPDATRWVYTGSGQYTQPESPGVIVTSAAGNSGATAVTSTGAWMPRWAPDATRIAFLRADGIYVINAAGGTEQRIVSATGIRGLDW